MKFTLGTIQKESNRFYFGKPISEEIYNQYVSASKILREFESNNQIFQFIEANLLELKNLFEFAFQSMLKESANNGLQINKPKGFELHFNINRLFMNYLSSVRAYVDHSETVIKRRFGKESEEYKIFEKCTNDLFDNRFSYCFFYKLRNYTQHVGLPISNTQFTINYRKDGKGFEVIFDISFNKNELIANYSEWGAIVKKKLTDREENNFDVPKLVLEYQQDLINIKETVKGIYDKSLVNSSELIYNLSKDLIRPGYEVCLFADVLNNKSLEHSTINIEHVPIELCFNHLKI